VLEENRPTPRDAIRADTAYVMTNLLRGVVQRGTARRGQRAQLAAAGKTGTVDDYTDAWFIGFDPNITVGVWVGHDEKKPIGPAKPARRRRCRSGSTSCAPTSHLACRSREPADFEPPGNIVFMPVEAGATGASPC
jgi:membrane carboxypeptidase/penicillin-binding protein